MKCCVCLCVSNNEKGLPAVLKNILKLQSVFEHINILAFYDKSHDKSLEILNSFKETYTGTMEIIVNPQRKSYIRTENIAFARNALLTLVRDTYSYCEYFIMMDSNHYSCVGELNPDVVKEMLTDRLEEWDAISFDREGGYYDLWALSFEPFVYSFYHFTNWKLVLDKMREMFKIVLEYYKVNKPNEFINVHSAFNGFAIYKTKMFVNCSYSSNIQFSLFLKDHLIKQMARVGCNILNKFDDDCEHRKFHMEAIQKNGARIRICTKSVFAKVEGAEV